MPHTIGPMLFAPADNQHRNQTTIQLRVPEHIHHRHAHPGSIHHQIAIPMLPQLFNDLLHARHHLRIRSPQMNPLQVPHQQSLRPRVHPLDMIEPAPRNTRRRLRLLDHTNSGIIQPLSQIQTNEKHIIGAYPRSSAAHNRIGSISSSNAASTTCRLNHPVRSSINSQRYSCRNHASPITRRSSSKNVLLIRGHSVTGAIIRSHCGPPFTHVSQKNPRVPRGVLIIQRSPSFTASIGRSDLYISSRTTDASSISSSDTAEKPRTLASFPGSPTIRLPFGSRNDSELYPSPRIASFRASRSSSVFRINAPVCRSLGLATSTRHLGSVNARCTAFAETTVDFPHCREQFKIPRFAVESRTMRCRSSATNPSFTRTHSETAIGGAAGVTRSPGSPCSRESLK